MDIGSEDFAARLEEALATASSPGEHILAVVQEGPGVAGFRTMLRHVVGADIDLDADLLAKYAARPAAALAGFLRTRYDGFELRIAMIQRLFTEQAEVSKVFQEAAAAGDLLTADALKAHIAYECDVEQLSFIEARADPLVSAVFGETLADWGNLAGAE